MLSTALTATATKVVTMTKAKKAVIICVAPGKVLRCRWVNFRSPRILPRAGSDELQEMRGKVQESGLTRNFRLHELREELQRFLPSEIAHLNGDRVGNAFLGDVDLRADEDLLQFDRRGHHAGQVGVVELVGMTDALPRHEFQVLAAEGMALARPEVGERHLVASSHARIDLVDLAGESVGR